MWEVYEYLVCEYNSIIAHLQSFEPFAHIP